MLLRRILLRPKSNLKQINKLNKIPSYLFSSKNENYKPYMPKHKLIIDHESYHFPHDPKNENWSPNTPKHKFIIDPNSYRFPHPIWNLKDSEKVEITHSAPKSFKDKIALGIVKNLRRYFDWVSGYRPAKMDENLYIRRCIFLETIAGVPGFIAGMFRHLGSLRSLREDGGRIHHLLEEAENERMHLFFFLQIKQPGIYMRSCIIMSQFLFIVFYSSLYLLSQTTAHRFVGYLEEEAVKTYTLLLKEIDEGKLPNWKQMPAPLEAIKYWGLAENACFRDVIVSIRADEVRHREFNHHFADIPKDMPIAGHKFEMIDKENLTLDEKLLNGENEKQGKKIETNVAATDNNNYSDNIADSYINKENNFKSEKNFDHNIEFGKAQDYQEQLNRNRKFKQVGKSHFHNKQHSDRYFEHKLIDIKNKETTKHKHRYINKQRRIKTEENEKESIKLYDNFIQNKDNKNENEDEIINRNPSD